MLPNYKYVSPDGLFFAPWGLCVEPVPESDAEAAEAIALQTLPRMPGVCKPREAFGLRRVHRRLRNVIDFSLLADELRSNRSEQVNFIRS